MSIAVTVNEMSAESSSVAAISTNARIDYILRFNKQAVLVVGETDADYSRIGSLFLGNLPAEHNASYVAASVKLNDIQVRCRIIEQLFADVLFDPEQALAVSILRLAKGSKQPISIVIDHAHHLSFQLIHELTYLAQVAKKAKLTINVVMLGDYSAGSKIVREKSLFNNKIALVDAQSGQLLKLDNKLFHAKKMAFLSASQRKFVITFIALVSLLAITLLLLSQSSVINLFTESTDNSYKSEPLVVKAQFVNVKKDAKLLTSTGHDNIDIATQADIYQALLQANVDSDKAEVLTAQPSDILSALAQFTPVITEHNQAHINAENEQKQVEPANKAIALNSHDYGINPAYYLAQPQGYVIQIAGLVNKTAFDNAVERLTLAEYYGYSRLLNNNKLLILTTRVYPTRAQAKAALTHLPESIRQQSPWIKPLSVIKKEIIDYQNTLKQYN